jgi:hypothetical protein
MEGEFDKKAGLVIASLLNVLLRQQQLEKTSK